MNHVLQLNRQSSRYMVSKLSNIITIIIYWWYSIALGVYEGKNHHQKINTRGRREANKRLLSISDPFLFDDINYVEDCSTLISCESCIEAEQMIIFNQEDLNSNIPPSMFT